MSWRLKKQLIYGLITAILFLFIFFLIYSQSKIESPPSCFDGKKNQGEEGIDCGGPCPPCELKFAQPLKIYPVQFLTYKNTIDLVGLIENPNPNLALKKLKYCFEIYDFDNVLKITTPIKITNIGPETRKYLLEINYPKPEFLIGKARLKILEPKPEDWIKTEKEKFQIVHYNETLLKENNKWKIKLTLFNQSHRSQDIEVIALVYNQSNYLIGVGMTKTYLSIGEVKDVYIFLPELTIQPASFEIYIQK